MGSPNPTATRITVFSKNKNMSALDFVAPLAELAQNEKVQTKVVEAAKLFSSGTITLNLVPAILSGSLLLLLLVPLAALLLQPQAAGGLYGFPQSYTVPDLYNYPTEYRSDEGFDATEERYRSMKEPGSKL